MECLDTETLCMHLDHELDAQQQQDVLAHLGVCQACTAKLVALQEDDAVYRQLKLKGDSLTAHGLDCLGPEELSAYASGSLTSEEGQPIEQHLQACDTCLTEVMTIRKMMRVLRRDGLIAPPAHLAERVKSTFTRVAQPSEAEKLGTFILQLARDGLKFIEAALIPQHTQLTIGGHLLPAGAFRGSQTDAQAVVLIDIHQRAGDLDLRLSTLPEAQQTVLLRLQVHKQGRPVVRGRVSLSTHERTLSSRQTSDLGEVEFPRLTPGDYTLRLPQEHIETQIILRPAPEEK
jgi:anti-sigma factor RsiW